MSIMKKPQPKTPASKSTSFNSLTSKKSISTKSFGAKAKPVQKKKKKGCFGCCSKKRDTKKQSISSKKSAAKSPRPTISSRPSTEMKPGNKRPPSTANQPKMPTPMVAGTQQPIQSHTQPFLQAPQPTAQPTVQPFAQPFAQPQVPALAKPMIAPQPISLNDNKQSPNDIPVKNVTPKVQKPGIESDLCIRTFARDGRFNRSFLYTISFPMPKPKVQKKKKSMVANAGRGVTSIDRQQKGKCKCASKFRRIVSVTTLGCDKKGCVKANGCGCATGSPQVTKEQTGNGKMNKETVVALKQIEALLDQLQQKIDEKN